MSHSLLPWLDREADTCLGPVGPVGPVWGVVGGVPSTVLLTVHRVWLADNCGRGSEWQSFGFSRLSTLNCWRNSGPGWYHQRRFINHYQTKISRHFVALIAMFPLGKVF